MQLAVVADDRGCALDNGGVPLPLRFCVAIAFAFPVVFRRDQFKYPACHRPRVPHLGEIHHLSEVCRIPTALLNPERIDLAAKP